MRNIHHKGSNHFFFSFLLHYIASCYQVVAQIGMLSGSAVFLSFGWLLDVAAAAPAAIGPITTTTAAAAAATTHCLVLPSRRPDRDALNLGSLSFCWLLDIAAAAIGPTTTAAAAAGAAAAIPALAAIYNQSLLSPRVHD